MIDDKVYMHKGFVRTTIEILAVALAYFGAARCALLLAIPPGYATAIWPSAGIALAALLFRGRRVAPGIFLGSFLANAGTAIHGAGVASLLGSLAAPACIGLGAMAEGLVGASLIRRFVGYPTELIRARDTLVFLALAGPVSCTISATIGVVSLVLTHTLPLHSYAVNWCIWWGGDTIGALIITPLALTWFGEPRPTWRRHRRIVALPLCLALAATVGVFAGTHREFLIGADSLVLWAVLAGGLILTGMLGAFLLVVSGQIVETARLAATRTAEFDRRHTAEAALRMERSQLHAIVDHAPVLISITDLQDRMMLANRSFLDAYAIPPSLQYVGRSIDALMPPEIVAPLKAHNMAALSADKPIQVEETVHGHDGSWQSFLTERFPVRDLDTEQPFGICAIGMDITRQRRAEEELRKFKFFSDHASEKHLLFNQQGRILYANARASDQLGYTEAELLALNISDIIEQFPPAQVRRLFEHCRLGSCPPFEACHRRKDATTFPVEVAATALEFGHEWLMFSSARDTTERKQAEKALRASESQLHATFDQAAVGMANLSWPELNFMRVNQAFCRMTGYRHDELLGLTAMDITFPDDRQICADLYDLLMTGAESSPVLEKRFVHKEGGVIWVRATVATIRESDGSIIYLMGVVEDITQARQAEQDRQETERRLELAISIAKLGTWEWDLTTDEVYWSRSFKLQLGYEDSELLGSYAEWESRLHAQERHRVLDHLRCFVERPASGYDFEYRLRHRDGSYHWFQTRAMPVYGADGNLAKLIGIHLDVTGQKLGEQRALEAALHDSLTGLPGRALVFEYAGHLLASAKRSSHGLAMLFIDLDRFKAVNDDYGHETGDRLLAEVARRLRSCVREEDLVGRLGGDEFVIVLPMPDGGPRRAEIVANHVVSSIGKPFEIDSHVLSVSPSIGISQFPADGNDIDTLIHTADTAMYQVKKSGRDNFQFYVPGLERRDDQLLEVESALRRALNNAGLALHYQPVVDMKSNRVIGAEALLRLSGSTKSDACPPLFVVVAESSGLIGRLGEWIAVEACQQHQRWLDQGMPPIPIAINVSPLQFRQGQFAERLTHIVSSSGMAPDCLQIEITESAVMENIDDAVATLHRIRALGIKVALDDFGTGYSSLSHLSTLPLDKLKVDQSFVRQIATNRTSRAITKAIIVLGRTLKLEVVGEGIESPDALAFLRKQGCDQAQGFLFSRAMPADDFATWYRSRSAEYA
jgi:diguanylate cyclase (GGDEF)-like protein/PAS domain S-box-containing protein